MVKLYYRNTYIYIHRAFYFAHADYGNNINTRIPVDEDANNNNRDIHQIIYTFKFLYLFSVFIIVYDEYYYYSKQLL